MRLEQSTLFSTSHLAIKQVLGKATYYMTEYCPLIGPQYPVKFLPARARQT